VRINIFGANFMWFLLNLRFVTTGDAFFHIENIAPFRISHTNARGTRARPGVI